jgi:hypothetical protein
MGLPMVAQVVSVDEHGDVLLAVAASVRGAVQSHISTWSSSSPSGASSRRLLRSEDP